MTTFVAFTPSSKAAFRFQPSIDGVLYNVVVTWNVFGQRYYINVTDLSGNTLLCRPLVSCGPSIPMAVVWALGTATVNTALNHNVPLGTVANIRLISSSLLFSNEPSGFDGTFAMLSTGPQALTYALPANPGGDQPMDGLISFDLNLLGGLNLGTLLFHQETQQFEF